MNTSQNIKKDLHNLAYAQAVSLLLIGAFMALALSVLDYIVAREHFAQFFLYRFSAALIIITNYFILKNYRSATILNVSIVVTAFTLAAMVELMILSFGGHQSPYYMGMAIIMIFMMGFLPVSAAVAAVVNFVVYATYLFPLIVVDSISNMPIFINSNVFLLAIVMGSIGWRYVNHNLLVKNLSLQYDLAEQKKHLEVYSLQLKSMVDDRTVELKKSNQRLEALFENATDGIVVLDRNGIIVNVNERACEMHGFTKEALVGAHSSLLDVEENRQKSAERMAAILRGESVSYETQHFKKDGGRVSLEVSSKAIPVGDEVFIQSFLRDITEKKKIQEHLFQSQKMDSIGMLAGGIAHDFNNVLTAILGYTDVIRKDVGANEKVLNRLSIIESAARKAGRMVSQLLGFSRKAEIEVQSVNINDVVNDTIKLLERVIDKRIVVRLDLAERLPTIDGDFNQLEQVLMNFIVNARDAMPYGGVITVSSSIVEAGPGSKGVPPYVPAGSYVVLNIADTGVGIPEEIQRKIFEPFFTTKERGKGTGLGLAMVYGVVTEHKGYVTVLSRINEGTTFTVYLPVSAKAAAAGRKPSLPATMRGHELILLVDDDENVLGFIKDALETNGYKVIATSNPMNAIDAYKTMSTEIALVITDVVMPLVDGRELMKKLADIDPAARFLTVSGYSKYSERQDDVKPDVFLQKPFDSRDLLTAVRRIIDKGKKIPAL